ncbi:MAG: hypothetical protein NT033_00735, partial [Candidatus Omnitrophica bacterium]|nr:hypothetical protein [Candidatus Omnitrophota bacterium]
MAAKQADPDCTVIGGCLWTVQFTRELEKIFDLGGLDYMDIYSYHAYGTLERSLEQELDARALKGKVKDKYGRDLRVWMTEGGIVSWPFLPSVLGADVQSAPVPLFRYDKACEALARIYLKALAYGNEKFFYYYLGYPLA